MSIRRLPLVLAFIIMTLPICVYAQNITFAWDAHPEAASITGFKLYQSKQSGNFTTPIATFVGGNLTTGQIPKPSPGRWYWVLTAYVMDGSTAIESGFSNEVTDVIKPKEPTGFARTVSQALGAIKSFFQPKRGLRIES